MATGHSHPPKPPVLGRPPSGRSRFVGYAQIFAWTGESDEAFRLLDHLLAIPSGLTVPIFKLDPAWDPLRKDPRFQALINKYAAKN